MYSVFEFTKFLPTPTQEKSLLGDSCAAFTQRIIFGLLAVFGVGSIFSGELAAADFDTIATAGTNNVAIADGFAYAATGTTGVVIVDLSTSAVAGTVTPPATTDSIDDVSADGDLLFTLDASGSGAVAVYSIENPQQPVLVSGPVSVDVSPFAGVSAASNRVIVSGGTGLLNVIAYQEDGTLSGVATSIDLGIGQPDVLIADDGQTAYVSTDFAGLVNGQSFGITVIDISNTPGNISIIDQIGIVGAGFSAGFSFPANFPIESAIEGDTLFVASGDGLAVFDVSNPASVQSITQIALSTNPVNVDVVGDTVYVVGNTPAPTLTVIDVSDLNSPVVETVNLPAGGNPLSVAATSSHVVVADSELGVLVESLIILGDINRDGMVDFSDIPPFIDVLVSGDLQEEADTDRDGSVTFSDIPPFIDILVGQ